MVAKYENGNTVRISLTFNDLKEHDVRLVDFLSDQRKVENLFFELVEELDLEDHWEDPSAMTFQIRPHAKGVDILVTDDYADLGQQSYDEVAQGLEEFLREVSAETNLQLPDQTETRVQGAKSRTKGVKEVKKDPAETDKEPEYLYYTLSFPNILDIVKLAKTVTADPDESELYQYEGEYYLTILDNQQKKSKRTIMSYRSLMLEYGKQAFASRDILREHGKVLIDSKALQVLKSL